MLCTGNPSPTQWLPLLRLIKETFLTGFKEESPFKDYCERKLNIFFSDVTLESASCPIVNPCHLYK